MRIIALFGKTMIENIRDWKILILTLIFAPFFVIIMYYYFEDASKVYKIIIINNDRGIASTEGSTSYTSHELLCKLRNEKYPDGSAIIKIIEAKSIDEAKKSIIEKDSDLAVIVPENFSQKLEDYRLGKSADYTKIVSFGNSSNQRYLMAAVYFDTIAYKFSAEKTGIKDPLVIDAKTTDDSKSLSEFELYVPGLLALSLMMLMFTVAASIIREKDKGTIVRLQLSNMRIHDFIVSISLSQVIIGISALGLTFETVIAFGYKTSASPFPLIITGIISCFAIVAVSILVAAFLRSIFDLMTIGCFPFFIMMFFSGGMFPIPALCLFEIWGHAVSINDILPTTHTISAFGKILNYNAGFGDISFEILSLLILTFVYYTVGTWFFRRNHLS